ncbi:MAG TPA: M48 family metalloprotease [Steroidobacteraceae bacterium]|nr:M48 family metalloprotease [Steroidobacteraceae bacterium]
MRANGIWTVLLAAIALAGCGTNPVTGKRELQLVTADQEVKIGEEQYFAAQQMQGGEVVTDPKLTQYVQSVGQKLAGASDRELPYEFVVLDNSVPNAWALPGGKIALNSGLLQELQCESELAAVLAHEITHAAARHGAKSVERALLMQGAMTALQIGTADEQYANLIVGGASLAASLLTQKYGRDAERQADEYGMEYMKRAGYDPSAAVDLQKTFVRLAEGKRPGWLEGLFASHPPSEERVANSIATAAKLGAGGDRGCEPYREATAGLRKLEPAYDKYDAGIEALQKKALDTAAARAREALALAPNQPKFHELLGDVALSRKQFQEAIGHYDRARELNPRYFKPYLASGVANLQLDRTSDAAGQLTRSMELLPTATGAYYLGRIAHGQGNIEQAVRYYQLAASSDSDVGRASARELVLLDLPRNPGRYVRVQPRVDQDGRVWMVVQNDAPFPIEDVVVAVVVADPSGRGALQGPVRVGTGAGALAPGQVAQIPTQLGPIKNAQELRLVQAEVQGARVAR